MLDCSGRRSMEPKMANSHGLRIIRTDQKCLPGGRENARLSVQTMHVGHIRRSSYDHVLPLDSACNLTKSPDLRMNGKTLDQLLDFNVLGDDQ